MMKEIIRNVVYSFPVQLLLLHLKKHHVLLLFWFLLFAIVSNKFGGIFGLSYLFLDPEYLDDVGFVSFFIIGAAFGGFNMVYQLTSYILNSYRFPFLATLNAPFASYFLNNSLVPLSFFITYLVLVIRFQSESEFATGVTTITNILGLLFGFIVVTTITATYFFKTNKNVSAIVGSMRKRGKEVQAKLSMKDKLDWERVVKTARVWRVENYITRKFKIRLVRGVEHYDERLLLAVFRQHHLNALFIEILAIAALVVFSYLIDYKIFILPAGASILLLFSILIMLFGAFSYWTRGWKITAFIFIIIVVSLLVKYNLFNYDSLAYGMNYKVEKAAYSSEELITMSSSNQMAEDKDYMKGMLNNWKAVASGASNKPKMVFIHASGGGTRSSLWTLHAIQSIDSIFGGKFMDNVFMMTGASGGMIGLAYFREIYAESQKDPNVNLYNPKYKDNISKDLLNPVTLSIVVNDLFYPWQNFKINGQRYKKDRAYMFEKYLNINTEGVLNKDICYRQEMEYAGQLPFMLITPTIITDERRLLITPHPVSYLMRPLRSVGQKVDGVDFSSIFKANSPCSLVLSSALRMNATYPYILPMVTLPTNPPVEVMDAGIRDNFGFEIEARFIYNFKDWVNKHTSGIIFISFNSVNEEVLTMTSKRERSFVTKLFNPIGNLYDNWMEIQTYNQAYLQEYLSDWLDVENHFIEFNYIPGKKDEVASMSFHLTTKEKKDILNAFWQERNQTALKELQKVFH